VTDTAVPVHFATRAERALRDGRVRQAVRSTVQILADSRLEALQGLADPDALRDAARDIRHAAVANLPELLDRWEAAFRANGGTVHRAADADAAVDIVLRIAAAHAPALITKGKSMASEEIHLNGALARAGHRVVETDLGEFIIQLAGEAPSHLIVPAIHKTRQDVAALFSDDAGHPVPPVVADEAAYARARLRRSFLDADIGITGVNFAIADTGSICLVENEGNGRMCTTLPTVHIAIMGMERIVADWAELDVMLALLARSATGQALSVYTNVISGPRRPSEADGPDEVHVIVLDNGRSNMLGTPFADALDCIRCGACLNVCPVYRHVGGHAYGSVYPGPIGAVLTPLLRPDDPSARELPEASTLCGACTDACPVRIPLHELLLRLRMRDARADASRLRRAGFALWSRVWSSALGYRVSIRLARAVLRIPFPRRRGPGWLGAWTRGRALPRVSR
jgi:L-lactate dehydrogenase complex protein LldF